MKYDDLDEGVARCRLFVFYALVFAVVIVATIAAVWALENFFGR